MNWDDFFARTLEKSGLSSYAQLAPKLGISDGAISHYRTGKRVPQVWVVAEALKVQGHPQPEKAAIEIMKAAALTSPERNFWRRLAATATLLAVGVLGGALQPAQAATRGFYALPDCALCEIKEGFSRGCRPAAGGALPWFSAAAARRQAPPPSLPRRPIFPEPSAVSPGAAITNKPSGYEPSCRLADASSRNRRLVGSVPRWIHWIHAAAGPPLVLRATPTQPCLPDWTHFGLR